MKYLLAFLLYIYIMTGVFLGIKISYSLLKHLSGKIIMGLVLGIYYGMFWIPLLLAEKIKKGVMEE
ncbi:hypothetical protein [Clostridium haemolyticum]|uniref:Uncharacterized protein n=1 Tax=Clostridium haemolyticum NCTC 9693 TaxID=1443114 RepID=A0ABR4TGZ0_CLOHA|nr:hypothetical protein [Clostridium haemolyticum]KEI18270.1 hypothetical protein Z960_03920 [Clostridium haemolyticum NCTC 9693]KGN04195.1 hypothetical protein Z961_04400 [Clostridium haemolyticum NCTC 8350]